MQPQFHFLVHRMPRTVLITGATGKQGGSVIQALLDQNADFEILAVTRDASSKSAQKLEKKSSNIKLVQGNLDQAEDIFICAKRVTSNPIWGVFSVQVTMKYHPEIQCYTSANMRLRFLFPVDQIIMQRRNRAKG